MTLAAIQQRFHATVTGVDPTGVLDWPVEMRDGFAVYRTAYRARLLDCLRGGFDKCQQWIGEDSFRAAAAHHLILHPPASWTLDDVGQGFGDTLALLFPGDPEVEELAWLEWEMQQAFTDRDHPALTIDEFAARASSFDEDQWRDVRLTFVQSCRSRAITTDCATLWTAIDQSLAMPPLDLPAGTSTLIVWRRDLRCQFRLLDDREAEGFKVMQAGGRFHDLCEALVLSAGNEEGVRLAGTMLGRWISDGLVSPTD